MFRLLRNEWILFWGLSRRLFTLQLTPLAVVLLALPFAAQWMGTPQPSAVYPQCLGLALAGAILLSMNLLPQEIEDGTLETTFTLPTPRNRLILRHLLTVWIWLALYFALLVGLYVALAGVSPKALVLAIFPVSLFFSSLTVWLSALVRNGPVAGLLAGILAFIHYRYLPDIGPLHLFVNPLKDVTDSAGRELAQAEIAAPTPGLNAALFFSLALTWLFVELLLRRMRRSELWMR